MGEIRIDVDLENPFDRGLFERGLEKESDIRRARVEGVVDTGAVMSMLPSDLVEQLVQAMLSMEKPTGAGATEWTTEQHATLDSIVAAHWRQPSQGSS